MSKSELKIVRLYRSEIIKQCPRSKKPTLNDIYTVVQAFRKPLGTELADRWKEVYQTDLYKKNSCVYFELLCIINHHEQIGKGVTA